MINQNKIFSFKIKCQAKNVFPSDVERTVEPTKYDKGALNSMIKWRSVVKAILLARNVVNMQILFA